MGQMRTGRANGEPLVYNQTDPYLPDLLISRQEHAARVLDSVRAHDAEKAAG